MPYNLTKPYGSVNVSVPIRVLDNTTGLPETAYSHDSTDIDMWYRREGGSKVSITEAALASWGAGHVDGGVEHGADGVGRLDLPDAACAWGTDGATYVQYGGTITGMIIVDGVIQLTAPTSLTGLLSGTHSTSTADLGPNAPSEDQAGSLLIFPTHDIGVFITSYNTGTGVATFDAVSGLSLSNNDPWVIVHLGKLDSASLALINAQVDSALSDYDPPTKAELDSAVAGLSTLDASGVRSALGLSSANLDTQLASIVAKLGGVEEGEAASGTLTTSAFTTNLTAPAANCWANRRVVFLATATGCPEQVGWVESNTAGAGSTITLKSGYQLQNAPDDGDAFVLV